MQANNQILQKNKNLILRITSQIWSGENVDLVDELVSEKYIEYAPFGEVVGIKGYKEGVFMFTGAFPDIKISVGGLTAEEDRVAFRFTATGTHLGEFMGIPASGKKITFTGMDITRIEDNKVVEEWISMDLLGLMEQIKGE